MRNLQLSEQVLAHIHQKLNKYEQLVWYARNPPAESLYWETVMQDIREGALNSAARVRELFPDDTDTLQCIEHGDWAHGFNSGVLAALRFVLSASESVEEAERDFPELYT